MLIFQMHGVYATHLLSLYYCMTKHFLSHVKPLGLLNQLLTSYYNHQLPEWLAHPDPLSYGVSTLHHRPPGVQCERAEHLYMGWPPRLLNTLWHHCLWQPTEQSSRCACLQALWYNAGSNMFRCRRGINDDCLSPFKNGSDIFVRVNRMSCPLTALRGELMRTNLNILLYGR